MGLADYDRFCTASVFCRIIDCATGAVDGNKGIAESVWRKVEEGLRRG